MTPQEITQRASNLYSQPINPRRITDEIFLIIERNTELMRQYLLEVEVRGRNKVNSDIGKEVKRIYELTNANERERKPHSSLIKSHQIFV